MKTFCLFLLMFPTLLFAAEESTLISKATMYVDLIAQLCLGLSVVATIVTRFTPKKKDDELVDSWVAKLSKGMSYLPTFGINPRTKELEKALEEAKKK